MLHGSVNDIYFVCCIISPEPCAPCYRNAPTQFENVYIKLCCNVLRHTINPASIINQSTQYFLYIYCYICKLVYVLYLFYYVFFYMLLCIALAYFSIYTSLPCYINNSVFNSFQHRLNSLNALSFICLVCPSSFSQSGHSFSASLSPLLGGGKKYQPFFGFPFRFCGCTSKYSYVQKFAATVCDFFHCLG